MRTTIPTINVVLTAFASFIDGPTGNGTIEVYEGAPAGSLGAPPGGTLLGRMTFSRPSYQTPSGGNMDSYTINGEVSALADGTMGCFVIKNSSGTICCDGTIGVIGVDDPADKDILFDEVDVEIGDPIVITSLRITHSTTS